MGGGYAIVRFRCSYLEVDLYDMRSANLAMGVIGRECTLQLHLPIAKSTLHYWVVSRTFISLSGNEEWNSEPKPYDVGDRGC